MKPIRWLILPVFLVTLALFVVVGCKSEEEEDSEVTTTVSTVSDEITATFTESSSTALSSSIIDLPASLKTSSSSSSRIAGPLYAESDSPDDESDGGYVGIYSGIRHYVAMAEMMKDMVKSIMADIIKSSLLQVGQLGTEIEIPEDASDPNAPRKVKIEKPDGATYEWKLSLYQATDDTEPNAIIRFDISGDAGRGQILMQMSETESDLTDAGITELQVTRYVDVVFDGTVNPKSLDVKMIQDLSDYRTYATENWSTLTDAQKEALDLGQPDKVFLSATKNDTTGIFTIYGTSYHPGWNTQAQLEGDDMMWGEDRTMYMFKAKADETAAGAKLFLSVPVETRADASADVWDDDSLSNVFSNMMLNQVNTMLSKMGDATDDASSDSCPDCGSLTVAEEQQQADRLLSYILYPPLTETKTYTETEYTVAKTYFEGNEDLHDLFYTYCPTVETFNNWNAGLGLTTANPGDDASKRDVYAWMMVAQADARAETNGDHDVTLAELEAFVDRDVLSSAQSFKDRFKSISYLINPAFYSDAQGFIGTLDTSSDTFYAYDASTDTMRESTDDSAISALKDLDLSNITSHVPADVKSATITVE